MREINCQLITTTIKDMCIQANCHLPSDLQQRITAFHQAEDYSLAKDTLQVLIDNATLAKEKRMPICQDTGMVTIYITIGQEVHIVGGSLEQAIQQGVREGYEEGYLRKSIVSDPVFDRKNTFDNTPAVIHYTLVEGERFDIQVVPKGFGSENMSQVKMCKPSDGIEGIQAFVYDVVKSAGPNACPPMVIGVGIGGTFDKVTQLAKKAMIRTIGSNHPDERYALLEKQWLEAINGMGIGPAGYGGKTTALALHIETFPTHIAGMPVAVSICCHVARHTEVSL
ncbi:fumarate hydratase [Tannockella kyphosi]|uniref:fumarate hydratase n=1 Tax=Tannockella kyphosi TaxID=2899121 RepID=UPI0020110177|nr:fumarate hydratase [Tannockella kyphosi]